MKKIVSSFLCASVACVFLTGCARDISPNVYSEMHVGETSKTYQGYIVSKRQVRVKASEKLSGYQTGGAMGGLGGAALGSTIGKGSGNIVATVIGGLAGAVGGTMAQKRLEDQNAFEYVVKLTSGDRDINVGELRTVVQGLEPSIPVGQRVILMVSEKGRSRIVPEGPMSVHTGN